MNASQAGIEGADEPVVGDGIAVEGSRWTFARGTPARFDDHIGKSVPGYRDGHRLVEQLSDFFAPDGGRVIEIGCSTGTLVLRLAQRHQAAPVDFLGVDVVPEMIEVARDRSRAQGNLRFEIADGLRVDYSEACMVIMYYTMQFIPVWQRPELVERICREMRPGGTIILFEKTRLPTGRLQDICNQVLDSYKLEQGIQPDEVLGKTRSLRGVLEPFTSAENEALLTGAGFARPHVIYRQLAFEGMVAIKPVI